MSQQKLRQGDLVEVKGPSEILATLDERGALADLPFMPEMAPYCGRRFTVERRAEKVCDTIHYTGSRRLHDSVMLEDLRCDGSGHDGCQAECRLFWKEAWLRKVSLQEPPYPPFAPGELSALIERTSVHARLTVRTNGKDQQRYRCQATDLTRCTEHLKVWDLRAYLREYTSGNVRLGRFLRVTTRAALKEPMRKLGLVPDVHVPGTAKKGEVFAALDLRPGELVRVLTKEEIAADPERGGSQQRPLVRPRDVGLLRGDVPRAPALEALHQRSRREHGRSEERGGHARGRGVFRRPQPAPLVLPARHLPVLAGVLA